MADDAANAVLSTGPPADDPESLLIANLRRTARVHWNGWKHKPSGRLRYGSSLTSFRLYNRNERVSGETRDLLIPLDEWLNRETDTLPPREGGVVIGIDLGGSPSMTAAAFYWPRSGRLECHGTFPSMPLAEISSHMRRSVRSAANVIEHDARVSPGETDAVLVKLAQAKGGTA